MTRPLTGKTALVTGAAKRIGSSIALALAEAGANVAITYLTSQSNAEATVRSLAEFDVDALAIRCDLRDPESIQQTMATVIDVPPTLISLDKSVSSPIAKSRIKTPSSESSWSV